MTFLQQAIDLLSRPPGSVIYHLLTLLILQAVVAISYSRWQREPESDEARRIAWAAGGILLTRLAFLLMGLAVGGNADQSIRLLPPLAQAVDLAGVVLLVWALVPFFSDRPRLADTLLLVSLVFVAVMLLFFTQEWQSQVGIVDYNSTVQAVIWGGLQLVVLAAGLVWLLVHPGSRRSLRPMIIGLLLLAHIAHFWNYPELIPSGTGVAYWVRLGELVVFPLWGVMVYRHAIQQLLTRAEAERASTGQLAGGLGLAARVVSAPMQELTLQQALKMLEELLETKLIAIGLIDEHDPQQVLFNHYRPAMAEGPGVGRRINLVERSAFRLAKEQQRGIELLPRGVGARQVHELAQQFNVGTLGPVYIEPLIVQEECLGFLLLGAYDTADDWTERDRLLVPELGSFIAQAVAASRRRQTRQTEEAMRLHEQLETAEERLHQAEAEAAQTRREVSALTGQLERLSQELARMTAALASAPPAAKGESQAQATAETADILPNMLPNSYIEPAIETAIDTILPVVREKNLQLDLSLDRQLPPVLVPPEILNQLLVSLLNNASDASAENGWMMVRALVEQPQANGRHKGAKNGHTRRSLHIIITDSGSGIHPEDKDRVFDSQHPEFENKPIPGLGQSSAVLAMTQKLAQLSGGDIQLESVVGVGSTFTVRLPVADEMQRMRGES